MINKSKKTDPLKKRKQQSNRKFIGKGRRLAFEILASQDALARGKGSGAKWRKRIRNAENELRQMGFDLEATMKSAHKHLESEASMQPANHGVGVYRLGNKRRYWS